LESLLAGLLQQQGFSSFEVIVIDNDAQGSASKIVAPTVRDFSERGVAISYAIEPEQNIALARNRAVATARGDYVAFIDDDEEPDRNWLSELHKAITQSDADGIGGPVLPRFSPEFPDWLRRSGLFDRPRWKTGFRIPAAECRTGNFLLRTSLLHKWPGPFNAAFGRTGGEDSDLFRRLESTGSVFRWANDAIVYEFQDASRASLRWHMKRAYRSGWGYAHQLCQTDGRFQGAVRIGCNILLGSGKALLEAARHMMNPRAAALALGRGMFVQLGKCGYFFHIRVEEYGSSAPILARKRQRRISGSSAA
jgi:succinoglycan biosynthesis protein ExoM